MTDWAAFPHKAQVKVEKYAPGAIVGVDTPEIEEHEQWFEADGTAVTDTRRIAELEAQIGGQAWQAHARMPSFGAKMQRMLSSFLGKSTSG